MITAIHNIITEIKYDISIVFPPEVFVMNNKEKLINLINSIEDDNIIEYLIYFIMKKFFK